ncbi:unnamed protein product [Allacma fusca]|uniref:Decapping nuclease n=1 Tax=Allacma fusca TaxID=39272 RepID=A0A8J2JFU0_9HEXA|nr:unnamed protein product [Allacma fusca]
MSVDNLRPIKIQDISEQTPFPTFCAPKILGCFSLDSHRKYIEGPEFLKFLQLSQRDMDVNFDLDKNCVPTDPLEEAKNSQETSELVQLLKWIHKHEELFLSRRPDFVLYRGLMSKILNTPYENRDGWTIGAISKNGTVYLRNIDTPQSKAQKEEYNANPRLKRMADWGYHFEHFLLSDGLGKSPDPSRQVKEECNIVYASKLNNHRILYAAELDGVWCKDGNDVNPKKNPELLTNCNLIELKTTRCFPNNKMTHNFKRFNLRKWWCQSFTARISDIIVGFRDDEGVVRQVTTMPLNELPKLGIGWSGSVCFNFLDMFLTEVKRIVGNDAEAVYIFEFTPEFRRKRNYIEINVKAEKGSDNMLSNLL